MTSIADKFKQAQKRHERGGRTVIIFQAIDRGDLEIKNSEKLMRLINSGFLSGDAYLDPLDSSRVVLPGKRARPLLSSLESLMEASRKKRVERE